MGTEQFLIHVSFKSFFNYQVIIFRAVISCAGVTTNACSYRHFRPYVKQSIIAML